MQSFDNIYVGTLYSTGWTHILIDMMKQKACTVSQKAAEYIFEHENQKFGNIFEIANNIRITVANARFISYSFLRQTAIVLPADTLLQQI